MKRLDVSQLLELSRHVEDSDDVRLVTEQAMERLSELGRLVAAHMMVSFHGLSHNTSEGILANFAPLSERDVCPEILDDFDPEGSWGEDKPLVLFCDDDPIQLEIAKAAFELHNFDVLLVETCEEAAKLFQQNRIDLLVTDICLPDGDGLDLAGMVARNFGKVNRLPIITVSGLVDTREAELKLEKLGGIMHLEKPVNWLNIGAMAAKIVESNVSRRPSFFRPRPYVVTE